MLLDPHDDRFQFADSEDAHAKMTRYIRENFSELLGADAGLLELPNGLEILQARIRSRIQCFANEEQRKAA